MLSKHKTDTKTQFIDATGDDFFKKATNNNVLEDKHINKIIQIFDKKKMWHTWLFPLTMTKFAENDYNLSVSSYVEAKDTGKKVDIEELNNEIAKTVAKINALRADIDSIIKEIEA